MLRLLWESLLDHPHHHSCVNHESFARQNYKLPLDARPKGQRESKESVLLSNDFNCHLLAKSDEHTEDRVG